MIEQGILDSIVSRAQRQGVSDVRIVSPDMIPVDSRFVAYCREPRCPGFGMSMSCPPNVEGPDWFREFKSGFDAVLVFKFDVPSRVLLSEERHGITRLIHETAAGIEIAARQARLSRSRGFAGGSCKALFCSDYSACNVLSGQGECRHPDQARQSMSGMGVDFLELSRRLDWKPSKITKDTDPDQEPTGSMAGMVFLG